MKKYILLTRLDSDDLIAKDFIEIIQKQEIKERKALICKKGYVFFVNKPSLFRRIKWRLGQILTELLK